METRAQAYIRSRAVPSDLESFKDSYDLHYFFELNYRGVYDMLRAQGWSKGRVFQQESADLMPDLAAAAEHLEGQVQVYDLGTFRGRLKALLAGVWRTPAVVVDGKKHTGLAAARAALRGLLGGPSI